MGQEFLLLLRLEYRQGDNRLAAVHFGSAGPEIRAGMQCRQAAVEPGISHQCRESIHALQQRRVAGDQGSILGGMVQTGLLQGCFERLGRQLGCTAATGHRLGRRHGRWLAEAFDEAMVNAAFPLPEQRGWTELPGATACPGSALLIAKQLQGMPLRRPAAQGATATAGFQVVGQRGCGPHGPHTGCRSWRRADHGAIAAGEDPTRSLHPQTAIGAKSAVLIHG